jgi:hypothetical protein
MFNIMGVELPDFEAVDNELYVEPDGVVDWDGEVETDGVRDVLISLA